MKAIVAHLYVIAWLLWRLIRTKERRVLWSIFLRNYREAREERRAEILRRWGSR